MHKYVVHVERTNMYEVVCRTDNGTLFVYNGEAGKTSTDFIDTDNGVSIAHVDAETWYTHEENTANILAKELATVAPRRTIHVYELRRVFKAQNVDVVSAEYSDKGLLP